MTLTKQFVNISELFHAPQIDIKNKACRLLEEQLWCDDQVKWEFLSKSAGTGYTVFLILRLIKRTRIHEDSNI